MKANEKHADLGCRTLLVHAQYAGMESSADKEEVIVDLLTSLLHLRQDYNYDLDDLLQRAKGRFLETFLRQTKADQGGDASFEDWVGYTAEDETEYGHDEAREYLALGGDLSEKDKSASGEWVCTSAPAMA